MRKLTEEIEQFNHYLGKSSVLFHCAFAGFNCPKGETGHGRFSRTYVDESEYRIGLRAHSAESLRASPPSVVERPTRSLCSRFPGPDEVKKVHILSRAGGKLRPQPHLIPRR